MNCANESDILRKSIKTRRQKARLLNNSYFVLCHFVLKNIDCCRIHYFALAFYLKKNRHEKHFDEQTISDSLPTESNCRVEEEKNVYLYYEWQAKERGFNKSSINIVRNTSLRYTTLYSTSWFL